MEALELGLPVVGVVRTLDLLGILAFALSGAMLGVRERMDVFGVLVLGFATGLGGGFLRDVLIGAVPPAALAQPGYLAVPLLAGLAAFFFHPALERLAPLIDFLDAVGLALFCVTGALKGLAYGLSPVPAALMGMVTAIGGGMLRDLLAGRTPVVFRGELYAIPALAGAAVAVAGVSWGAPSWAVAPVGAVLALTWRLLAMRRDWRAPLPRFGS